MRIHDRYLLTRFIRIFLISILVFTVIYITVDVFEEIDNFIDHDASILTVVRYYAFSVPFILTYIIPVSLLLGAIFAMGVLSRRNELTAFIASGISMIRVAAPIMVAAFLASLASTAFNDIVVTRANRHHKAIMRYDIEGHAREDRTTIENFHYLGENGFVYLASRYNSEDKSLFDVVLQQFDRTTLVRRIDAKRAQWTGSDWVFTNGFDRRFKGDVEHVTAFDHLRMPELVEKPEDLIEEEVDQENMNARELSAYIGKVRRSGGDVERYLTDLYFKFSYPLAGSIFVLFGIALASGKRKQSIATGFGLTLLISFVYYGVLRIGQTLGYNGVLPPLLAAEMGNCIFLIVGVGLVLRANR